MMIGMTDMIDKYCELTIRLVIWVGWMRGGIILRVVGGKRKRMGYVKEEDPAVHCERFIVLFSICFVILILFRLLFFLIHAFCGGIYFLKQRQLTCFFCLG